MTQPQSESQPHPELRALRHDLRGLMNAIVLCASALDDSLDRQEALEFVTHIETSSDKLVVLLEKLEAMSK